MSRIRIHFLAGIAATALAVSTGIDAAAVHSSNMAPAPKVEVDYALHCQGCHLSDGRGMAGKVPDLRQSLGDFLKIPGGREYIVQVPGVATSRLDDAGTARLLNWLVARMATSRPCAITPYTTEEVARLRGKWLRRAAPVRAALMKDVATLKQTHAAERNQRCASS